jgi:hypothetical protein
MCRLFFFRFAALLRTASISSLPSWSPSPTLLVVRIRAGEGEAIRRGMDVALFRSPCVGFCISRKSLAVCLPFRSYRGPEFVSIYYLYNLWKLTWQHSVLDGSFGILSPEGGLRGESPAHDGVAVDRGKQWHTEVTRTPTSYLIDCSFFKPSMVLVVIVL